MSTPAEAELAEERKTNGLLQVRLFEAEAELSEYREANRHGLASLMRERNAATQRAEAAEAERDRLREMCRLLAARVDAYPGEALLELFRRTEVITSERNRLHREIVRLTARVEELEAALRRAEATLTTITDRFIPGIDTWEDTDAEETLEVARAALATDKQP